MAILSGNRKILLSYFLLLNLSSMVKFSHNKAVLQLAMISLILLSYFCQTLRYDVGSLFISLSRTRNTLICPMIKVFINHLGCPFSSLQN